MNRRQFILAGFSATIVGAISLKPSDHGGAYNNYFSALNSNLKSQGGFLPSMLVDLDLLDKNIETLKKQLNPSVNYRIVAKSLPSPDLLSYIMDKAETNKLMVFHQPFLTTLAKDYPKTDILMGKPMPVKAAEVFYQKLPDSSQFNPSTQLQWLIDSEKRLVQYLDLARQQNTLLQVNIEIDVGLHRGGLQRVEELDKLLLIIDANKRYLHFSGFMGYDPHIVKIPSIIKSPEQAFTESQAIYQAFIERLYQQGPQYKKQSLCFNGAGSPSLALHKNRTVANELSAGSCLVKPVDFDIPSLSQYKPAAFIATPVLKKMAGTQLPALEFAKNAFPLWDKNMQQTFFIYGGKWLAKFESPKGLQGNSLFGTSTNQAIVNGSNNVGIDINDHVFLRPTQSESVFLQFGNILTLRNKVIEQKWTILAG
ncbi:alanine racemase [Colwellia psychrerythraea]|uniref:Alanine racemase domain protein n=1 Tax=Colwellia psychrerythraea TaxID=28229 RepID=A0A099KEB9_COLPS|nr:alanine racemase [Colwellia psychrerythraea]KGJ88605.1 alanine racemase domain protein [Colwellia psychrerythraea]